MKASAKKMSWGLIVFIGMAVMLGGVSGSNAAEKPKPGGTFVSGMFADPDILNPAISGEFVSRFVFGNIFSRLVYTDLEGDPVGDLAEKWTVSKDNLSIRFDLRKEAKWHDGRPVTAEDVKFSLESMAKYHPKGIEIKRISEIKVLGPNSLEIKFPSPSVTFFSLMDDSGFIIPKHIYGTGGDLPTHPANSKPIGSGPFMFQEWKKGDHATLVKNKNYYIPGEPFVDKAIFKIVSSGASRVLSLETGEIDYLAERALPESDVPRLRTNPNYVVTDQGMGPSSFNLMVFNTRRKPWNDVRVRRAVAHSVDRVVLADKGTFGLAQAAYSPFLKRNWPWAYNPQVEGMYPVDPARAGKMLDEAGYPAGPDGIRFKTTVVYDRGDSRTGDITEILREQLKKVGIDMVLQPLDKATMVQRVWVNADFDLCSCPTSQGADPTIGVERLYVTEAIPPAPTVHNANGYSNPEVDKLFAMGRSTLDQKKRGQYYRDVQPILLRDLPLLPLTDTPKFAAFSKKVKGVNSRRFVSTYFASSDAWFAE